MPDPKRANLGFTANMLPCSMIHCISIHIWCQKAPKCPESHGLTLAIKGSPWQDHIPQWPSQSRRFSSFFSRWLCASWESLGARNCKACVRSICWAPWSGKDRDWNFFNFSQATKIWICWNEKLEFRTYFVVETCGNMWKPLRFWNTIKIPFKRGLSLQHVPKKHQPLPKRVLQFPVTLGWISHVNQFM